jgi:hypothetical protein
MLFRIIALLVIVAGLLHVLWENAHVGLYTGYGDLGGGLPITVWATIGDVLYTLVAFALVSLFKHGIEWVREALWSDYVGLAILGFCIALYVEYKAFALARWAYTDAMPILPVFSVGVSPVLQMMILLPLTLACVSWIERRLKSEVY